MNKTLLLIFALAAVSYAYENELDKRSTTYGIYCGLGHGSDYGLEPVDQLDRICQIHNICVSALGYTSCACNEQLYAFGTQVYLTTKAQTDMRNYMLTMIYDAILMCTNYNGLGDFYFVNARDPGQNYMPFFPYTNVSKSKYVIITETYFFKYYLVSDYEQFTKDAYKGNKIFDNVEEVYGNGEPVEIPVGKVLVAITHFYDDLNVTGIKIKELDLQTSSYIYIQDYNFKIYENNTKIYINRSIVVSIMSSCSIITLSIVLIIYVCDKQKLIHKEYKLQPQ